jgi:predicted phosphodiesterase
MKIMAIADCHIGKSAKIDIKPLIEMRDVFRAEQPTRVVCAGDLFDTHLSALNKEFLEIMAVLFELRIITVAGNHEKNAKGEYSAPFLMAREKSVIHHARPNGEGLLIAGRDNNPEDTVEEIADWIANEKSADIFLIHDMVMPTGKKFFNRYIWPSNLVALDNDAKRPDKLVLSGDYHSEFTERVDNYVFHNPGTFMRGNISIVEMEAGSPLKIRQVKVSPSENAK